MPPRSPRAHLPRLLRVRARRRRMGLLRPAGYARPSWGYVVGVEACKCAPVGRLGWNRREGLVFWRRVVDRAVLVTGYHVDTRPAR